MSMLIQTSHRQRRREADKQNRSDAWNRFIADQEAMQRELRGKLAAERFSFGLTLLILGAAIYGIFKTGGLL